MWGYTWSLPESFVLQLKSDVCTCDAVEVLLSGMEYISGLVVWECLFYFPALTCGNQVWNVLIFVVCLSNYYSENLLRCRRQKWERSLGMCWLGICTLRFGEYDSYRRSCTLSASFTFWLFNSLKSFKDWKIEKSKSVQNTWSIWPTIDSVIRHTRLSVETQIFTDRLIGSIYSIISGKMGSGIFCTHRFLSRPLQRDIGLPIWGLVPGMWLLAVICISFHGLFEFQCLISSSLA